MPTGTVKFFNAAKGFGFITADESGKDVFVPAASVTAAGLGELKTGQRISFETESDKKGPKAVGLTLLAEAPKAAKPPAPQAQPKPVLTFYHNPQWDKSVDALAKLRAAGYEPAIVEYPSSPPSRDELKRLSMLLRESDQSLVRRFDPLFLALRLDDRFLSENEFWDAIVEHPLLINGPVVATATRASICQSDGAVAAFVAALSGGAPVAEKPKTLSERAMRLLRGEILEPVTVKKPAPIPVAKPAPAEAKKTTPAPAKQTTAKPKPTVKAKTQAKAAAKPKKAAKPAPRKAAPKAVKKTAKRK